MPTTAIQDLLIPQSQRESPSVALGPQSTTAGPSYIFMDLNEYEDALDGALAMRALAKPGRTDWLALKAELGL